ncbi:hypothetical protein ACFX2G_035974 [Malus domestica]
MSVILPTLAWKSFPKFWMQMGFLRIKTSRRTVKMGSILAKAWIN